MNFLLFKSESQSFSLNDLKKNKNQTTFGDGVKNYQARNFLRDKIKVGDKVLFYYSDQRSPGIVGI